MNYSKNLHKSLFLRVSIYLFIVVLGLMLLFFSNPNRLAHDQIYHKTFKITDEIPNPFENDYLFGDERRKIQDNYYSYRFIGRLSKIVGSDELVYWLLLPIVFIIFTVGMFELNLYLTNNHVISLLVALISNFHFNIFTAEWGLPGPSELDPWAIYWAITPYFLLLFVESLRKNRFSIIFTTLFISGIFGNVHLISSFYLIASLLLTLLLTNGLNKNSILIALKGGIYAIVGALPFLYRNFTQRVSQISGFDPSQPDQWDAYTSIAYHTTIAGRLYNLKLWIVDHGYTVWPLVAAMVLVLVLRRASVQPRRDFFSRFGLRFIFSVLAVNVAVSLVQIFRLLVLHQLPFWNEPRGVQLIYYVSFPFLALALTEVWERVQSWFTFQRRLAAMGIILALAIIIRWRLQPVLAPMYVRHITPRFTSQTCDAAMYRALADPTLPGGTILQDPGYWSAFRICTRRPVVVQTRDNAFAYSLGSDVMMAWYERNRETTAAFSAGGGELLRVAKKYGAKIIVSRFCAPVDGAELERTVEVPGEGCIYVVKPTT